MKAEEALKFDSEHRLRSENLCFDIDTWYPKLSRFTFDSLFLPLTRREAECILAFHDVSWRNAHQRPYLTCDEVAVLQNLEKSIQEEIDHLWDNNGARLAGQEKSVFVRLCGRSPKDGEPYDRIKPYKEYESHLQDLIASGLPNSANTQMIAIAKTKIMRVTNAKDAMALLLTSERVFAEALDWLRYGEPEQICLRVWEKELSLDYEFRAFICKGKMTAITQYDHYTYYPYLFPEKEMLQRGIFNYWKEVHPFVNEPDSSYVIDIAYLKDSKQFIMVELSPFTPCTGPALFHWQYDKAVLEGSYLPLAEIDKDTRNFDYCNLIEFRLKEAKDIHPNVEDLVEINWTMRWKQQKPCYEEFYSPTVEDIKEEEEQAAQRNSLWKMVQKAVGGLLTNSTTVTATEPVVSAPSPSPSLSLHYLFVYGTLKQGFHWNTKYLHPRLGAKYLTPARTVNRYALVIGDSGVPYLLGDVIPPKATITEEDLKKDSSDVVQAVFYDDRCQQLIGELWQVDDYCLKGLDDYEGIQKGYYERIMIPVLTSEGTITEANVYILSHSTADLREKDFLSEYSLAMHQQLYKPIKHIQVKQCNYYKTPSTWGKTNSVIEASMEKPEH